jgi:hypothetical protein
LLILGKIEFPSEDDAFSDATLNVTVQDTQEADARARILCKQVVGNVTRVRGSSEALRFAVECDSVRKSPFVTVSVLVDLDGDGCISRGDYINTESYPVQFSPHEMHIRIQRVR